MCLEKSVRHWLRTPLLLLLENLRNVAELESVQDFSGQKNLEHFQVLLHSSDSLGEGVKEYAANV